MLSLIILFFKSSLYSMCCCCCSVCKWCLALCNPMNCTTLGFPVLHCLLELAQTHVHRIADAIQPSNPLSSPSPALHLSQHRGLFQGICSLHQVAKVLEFQLCISPSSEYSRLIAFGMDWSDLLAVQGTLKSLLQHIVQKHLFFGTQPSSQSNSHIHTWPQE